MKGFYFNRRECFYITENNICIFAVILVAVIAIVAGCYSFAKHLATKMLGLEVSLDPDRVCRGEILKVLMHVNPTKHVEVPEIILKVECIRRSEHTDTRGRKHYQYDTMAKSEVFMQGMTLHAGQPKTIEGHIAIPSDGLPTNPYGTLTIKWKLTVAFMLPTFPAERNFELQVVDQSMRRNTPSKYVAQVQEPLPIASESEKPEFKQCSSCGGKNDVNIRFCTECGNELA